MVFSKKPLDDCIAAIAYYKDELEALDHSA